MSAQPTLSEMQERSIRRIKGPTILLGSGTYFDFEAPETSAVTIEDVAYGLAFSCRFAGQTMSRILGRRIFYSVAEHCVRMAHQAPPALRLQALLHELGEAVCGDMTGPLKSLCPDYRSVEKRCEAAIAARFGVEFTDRDAIKELDLRMLATERRDLMFWNGEEWDWTAGAQPFDFEIIPWAPDEAASRFLRAFILLAPEKVDA